MAKIRVWRLGDLEAKIIPTEAAIQRLADILMTRVDGQDLDVIWNPWISVQQLDIESGEVSVVVGANLKVTRDGNVISVVSKEPL